MSRGRRKALPEKTVKRIAAAITKYRFTTVVRAPWVKKHLKLRCHLSTVSKRKKGGEGREEVILGLARPPRTREDAGKVCAKRILSLVITCLLYTSPSPRD